MQIAYNLINLPRSISNSNDGNVVRYSYLSDGCKYRTIDKGGDGFLYTGSLKWKLQGGTITPESFAIAGGRATFEANSWTAYYYITDHLGSTRAVANTNGYAFATFDYTPYGSLLNAEDTPTGTDYLFTGKERQAKQGAGELYDSQARFMDTGGRFLSIDPMAEKFYHLSPYAYCAGDPVNLVDPDGRKIYFADGVPEWFKERYYATIEYMKETGTYDLVFRKLEEDDKFVVYIDYIETINNENRIGYSPQKNRIYWNPNAFIKNTNGTYTFPATILAHEGVHALQDMELDDNYDAFVGLHNTEDPEYDNLLDKEAIKNYEWDIARMHGDIEEYQVTRTNHSGIPYIFPMATINPFLGTNKIPEKNREDFNILLNIVKWNSVLKYYSTQSSR